MATPTITLWNGRQIHCDSQPQVYPCVVDGFACWNSSSSNCFGLIYDLNDPAGSGVIPSDFCTTAICPLQTFGQAFFNYLPSLPGNSIYAAIFGICLVLQIAFGIKKKTWGFMAGMICGLVLEVVGYAGRIKMHSDPFTKNSFLIYLVPLTIGPAFISASVYLCLSRIIVLYGPSLSRFSPRTYTILFISCDFFSLVLQAIGGGMASEANTDTVLHTGTHIMIAGLSFQVASLLLFIVLCADFALAARRSNIAPKAITQTAKFKGFLWALTLATIVIFVRSCFRVAELSKGFHGPLDNQEVTYMILEGLMIVTASISLTVFHPGWCFGGEWDRANFQLRKKKGKGVSGSEETEMGNGGDKIEKGVIGETVTPASVETESGK